MAIWRHEEQRHELSSKDQIQQTVHPLALQVKSQQLLPVFSQKLYNLLGKRFQAFNLSLNLKLRFHLVQVANGQISQVSLLLSLGRGNGLATKLRDLVDLNLFVSAVRLDFSDELAALFVAQRFGRGLTLHKVLHTCCSL